MAVVAISALIIFDTVLCIIEIPKMLQQKLIKELVTFSVLLLLGTTIALMKSFDIAVPNPSDFMEWVYSPLSGLMKSLLKP